MYLSPHASVSPFASAKTSITSAPDDVIVGLRAARKHLPCRLLYDALGAELFDQICDLPEYYPTRTELALLQEHLPAVAELLGPGARVVEPGSGAGRKTRMLLDALDRPASYVPIDISVEQLVTNAVALRGEFPGLQVHPVHGDYTASISVPTAAPGQRTLVFFPGSTIGNFEPEEAQRFLKRLAALAGPHGLLLLGADSNQDVSSLLPAYDDARGVTAAFDRNVLAHLNRSHDATFDVAAFVHRAVWDPERSRIEMHLVSRRRQVVEVAGELFSFERGEPIVTEHCYKHSTAALTSMLERAGWSVRRCFADAHGRMRLWLAECPTAVTP